MATHLRALRVPTLAIYLFLLGLLLFIFLHVFVEKAHAANPQLMNFQGKVTNADGTNVANGNYDFDFILYDDPTAGVNRWQEGWTSGTSQLTVTNGIFQVNLGTHTALPNFNTYPNLYLAIRFNNDAAGYMTPRVRLTSVPYALNSDAVGGLSSSNLVQLAQGVQTDSSTTQASIAINKTNASGSPHLIQLQKAGVDALVVNNSGDLLLGQAGSGGLNGKIVFNTTNASNTAITIQAASTATSYSITLPTTGPSTGECLQSDSVTASQLIFGSCGTGGGGDLQASYDSDSSGAADIITTSASKGVLVKAGATYDSNILFQVQDSAGTVLLGVDSVNSEVTMSRSILSGNILPSTSASISTSSTVTTKVVDADNVGQHTAIAIGTDGLPIISSYNATDPGLAITKCSNTSCSSSDTITITDADDIGQYTSMAIGSDGLPVIAHYNASDGDLAVTKCTNRTCSTNTTEKITDTDDFGQYTSIAIGADGFPVISHYNVTDTDLAVTKCTNLSCSANSTTKITSGSNVGFETSIAVGTDTYPIIAARNVSSSNLRITKCSTASCSSTSSDADISTAPGDGRQPYVKIGADGLPVIAHRNFGTGELLMLKCLTISCSSSSETTVASGGVTRGIEPSIAIGADGLPVVAHYNSTAGDLAITKCTTISCSASGTVTVTDGDDIGSLSSIIIGTDGLPIIASYNVTDTDLIITKCGSANCSGSSDVLSAGISLGSDGVGFQTAYIGSIRTSDTVNPFTIATNGITRLSINGSGTSAMTGNFTLQPSRSLISGETNFTQTLTNASSSGGTVQGFSQTITVAPTTSASTTNGINIALTDATTLANINNGVNATITDNGASGAKTNKAVVGTAGGTNANAINFGGYFSLSGGAATSAAIYGSNGTTTGNILQLQDATSSSTDVFLVADGGAVTVSPKGNNVGTIIKQTSGTATSGNVFDVQTANGSSSFIQITNATANEGAVTIQSIGATRTLTLGSGSGTIITTAATLQKAANAFTIDLATAAASTLTVTNSDGSNVASLSVEGDISVGSGRVYKIGSTSGASTTCSGGQVLTDQVVAGGITTGGTCAAPGGGATSLDDAYNQAAGTGNTITLTAAGDGVIIQDAATTVGGNLFAVQENSANGGSNLFAVTTTGLLVEHLTGNDALALDTTTSTAHLRIYGSDGVKHADIYYDNATNTAFYGASSGTAVLGSGTGAVSIASGAGTGVDIDAANGTIVLGSNTTTLQRAATSLTIDLFSASASTLNVTNTSAGVASISIEAGGSYTGAGATTISSGASSALTITGNAASTISTTAGNLVLQGGSGTVSLGTSTNLTASGTLTVASAAATALNLTGNAASTISTSAGDLTLQAGSGTVTLGSSTTFTASGALIIKPGSSSATAFQLQSSSSVDYLTLDSTNVRLQVGSSTTDATAVLFVLDSYNNATDPAGVNGASYYNSATDKFRCYEAGTWSNCISADVNYLAGSVSSTSSATYTTIFTIPLIASKVNIVQVYLSQFTSSNGVAPQNRARISVAGATGNCTFTTKTAAAAATTDNIVVATAPADTGETAFIATASVLNLIECAILEDGTSSDLIIDFQSETGASVTTEAGSYYKLRAGP